MHKLLDSKELREICTRTTRREAAFSLVELVVSMGIIMLMLTLAGQVMSLTVRSTGQAKALTEVNRALRIFERTLREDLSHVKPGNSLLLIQGNPINAYWSTEKKDAGILPAPDERPRADILMFFTSRRDSNYVQYDYTNPPPGGSTAIVSGVQQVVYGHANLIELDAAGTVGAAFPTFPPLPDTIFSVPADDWHLTRRVVHLLDLPDQAPVATPPWADAGADDLLGDPRILQGETDVMTRFNYKDWVLTPYHAIGDIGDSPLFWPKIFNNANVPPFARSVLDPTPPPLYADRLGHYFMPNCVSFQVEWTLDRNGDYVDDILDDEKELYWIDPGADDPLGEMERVAALPPPQGDTLEKLLGNLLGDVDSIKTYNLRDRFSGEAGNFDIEWHSSRFENGPRSNLVVFTAGRETIPLPPGNPPPGDFLPETAFPAALRITIHLVDDQKRMASPTRHVMIIPVGG